MEPLGVFLLEEASFLSFLDADEEELEADPLEVEAVDFEVDEEPDFCSLFFSLIPLWLAGVGFVFLL